MSPLEHNTQMHNEDNQKHMLSGLGGVDPEIHGWNFPKTLPNGTRAATQATNYKPRQLSENTWSCLTKPS